MSLNLKKFADSPEGRVQFSPFCWSKTDASHHVCEMIEEKCISRNKVIYTLKTAT